MEPVKHIERPHENVARQLRQAILDGTYAPGDRLPIERELSERFEVSRSMVRQALLILEQQGLVRVRSGVGGGPFVAGPSLPAAITALENLLTLDQSSVDEFARAKFVLEPVISAYAAKSITTEDLDRLAANLDRTHQQVQRGEDITETAVEFHSMLINSTRNRFLAVIVELLSRTLNRVPGPTSADPWRILAEHQRILEALRRHEPDEVGRLTRDHIASIWRDEIKDPAS
ncbi:FadR/GntR family transcriptional regulator [Streptomyces mirabilis]|jgi:DNA-binding FadR family transcriptional regulator|uniref:DNA-binding transcriptional regulator, FadR family n=1 Tax=Streptomyces mirabilis TaxID=68239 RepID=A0A1I2XGK4_9ACTN|nr:GntR family transcriptional regulator [Streptomyces mirabilis]SFH12623.1 DNA-binding transcriptional regulator, FadR family [Streptomyces mirabilis]